MVAGRYKSLDVANPRGGYRKPFVVTTQIFYHRDGHSIRPNKVVLKYPDFKKDVDLNVRVKMFNSTIKENEETSE
jgi:hypothetical protein